MSSPSDKLIQCDACGNTHFRIRFRRRFLWRPEGVELHCRLCDWEKMYPLNTVELAAVSDAFRSVGQVYT